MLQCCCVLLNVDHQTISITKLCIVTKIYFASVACTDVRGINVSKYILIPKFVHDMSANLFFFF